MITRDWFDIIFPTKGLDPRKYNLVARRDELISALNEFLPSYGIDTKKRVDAALSCWGYETDYFKTTEEYASGAEYEGRKDLGNTQKGDGKRYKGRGITQTTGRYNYRQVGFEDNPEALNDVRTAVETACKFWQAHNLNQYADKKQIKELNGVVNRGSATKTALGWPARNTLYSKCFRYSPADISFDVPSVPAEPIEDDKLEFAQTTLQSPSLKTVATKLATRVGGPIGAIWSTTAGKIALVLTGMVLIGGVSYTVWIYRKQIQLGWQIAVATFKKKVGLS